MEHNNEETLTEEDTYPSLRSADAPVPGRPRRRGQNMSSSSTTTSKSKKKKRKKKKRNTTRFSLNNIVTTIIISSKEWIFPHDISNTTVNLGIATTCWYLLGVLSITTSKMLLSNNDDDGIPLKPTWLTFQQLCIGAFLLHHILKYNLFGSNSTTPTRNQKTFLSSSKSIVSSSIPFLNTSLSPANTELFYVALFFALGFFMTNISFYNVVPSLVETIKAAEPITSAIIATLWKLERLGNAEIASLITIVFGVLLSTLTSDKTTHSITITSFLCVIASNLCFSFRGLHQKILQQTTTHGSTEDINDAVLQYRMQCIGFMLFLIPAFVLDGFGLIYSFSNALVNGNFLLLGRFLGLSLCNGFAFASYK